jgi:putative CocE/NonD family hydrolase
MNNIEILYDVEAPMRDGTVLRADTYLPAGEGPFPVILVRSPYDKRSWLGIDYSAVARAGYIVAVQDSRGSFTSEGEWLPWKYERDDGYDSVEWASALPKSNGKVGMMGSSYLASAQWSAAIAQAPSLAAIAPWMTWSDPEDGLMFRGGAIELGLNAFWSMLTAIPRYFRDGLPPAQAIEKMIGGIHSVDTITTNGYWGLPSGGLPVLADTGFPDIGVARALEDPASTDDSRVATRYDELKLPSLNISGWNDIFLQGALDNYVGMRSRGRTARLIVGPWEHQSFSGSLSASRVGEVNFGLGAFLPAGRSVTDLQLEWYDHWLKGEPATDAHESQVLIFVMGINQWRVESDWPLAREQQTSLYLDDASKLEWTPSAAERSESSYVYDPGDPAITRGGNTVMAPEFPAGVFDQRDVEARDDVLVFTSAPLNIDTEITGRVRAILHAATDGPSTDWIVRLCEVDAMGISRNLVDGITRVVTEPNRIDEVEIDLWSTSIVINAGNRLRVHVTSSNFPRWDRNLNTGEPSSEGTTIRVANQRILHDREHPSRIILPIIPT